MIYNFTHLLFASGCKQPNYGPHESKIIMTHIQALLDNNWIEECEGPWGSLIVLAPKPHQEHVTDINDFVWRMCVSYRNLNAVTKPFTYPIPRCDNAISSLGPVVYGDDILFISLDAKQGYHQILVKPSDREKLAFFAPNGMKYTFKVMPFGPTNAPSFYTCMMHQLQKDWELLFFNKVQQLSLSNTSISISSTNQVTIHGKPLIIGSKVIIDDILSYSNNIDYLLLYVECICSVFIKFRVSFQLKKCDFLKNRVEYVGHDLTSAGNCPASSKFDLIKNWPLPLFGPSLHSFIGLINFYHQYIPYFEISLKPLRALERKYRRKKIPPEAWTSDLRTLFNDFKELIISSPLLARYNPEKPTFLKTDWSAHGMGWILCQPDDDPHSTEATKILQKTGTCNFDLTMKGPRLRPIAFGSRSCLDTEKHFHSFVGEIACGRWAIAQNKRFLWGTHFYWMCDCNSIKEILNYNGSIHMLSRWSMELLGYNFTIIHRPAKMMADVDALNRRYEPHFQRHLYIAALLRHFDESRRPIAFQTSTFPSRPVRITPTTTEERTIPILTTSTIDLIPILICTEHTTSQSNSTLNNLPSSLLFLQTLPPAPIFNTPSIPPHPNSLTNNHSNITLCLNWLHISWLCIDDILQSFNFATQINPSYQWSVKTIYTNTTASYIMQNSTLHSSISPTTLTSSLNEPSNFSFRNTMVGCDFHYIHQPNSSIYTWLQSTLSSISTILPICTNLTFIRLWISGLHTTPTFTISHSIQIITNLLPNNWIVVPHSINPTSYNCPIHCTLYYFTISVDHPNHQSFHTLPSSIPLPYEDLGFNQYLVPEESSCPYPHDESTIPIPVQVAICSPSFNNNNFREPKIVANIQPNLQQSNQPSYKSVILDTSYPAYPPSLVDNPNIHLPNFHIPSWNNTANFWEARPLFNNEWLNLYSHNNLIHQSTTASIINDSTLYSSLRSSVPQIVQNVLLTHFIDSNMFDHLIFNEDTQTDCAQCFTLQPLPSPDSWSTAYKSDSDTLAIINALKNSPDTSNINLTKINKAYHQFLRDNLIHYHSNRLILRKPIPTTNKSVELIIIPVSLRRIIFDHYHGGPTGGHMGEYKTLYRLRMRFFWPRMRTDVKEWVQRCAQCIASRTWKNRKHDLYFSWPVTVPFWILHCDLWSPGNIQDNQGNSTVLNCMCDLTQFVVSSVTSDVTAPALSQLLMENVILKYGMCAVIVVDAGSNFRGMFEQLCDILNITLWPLSRGNHHGLSVERYHRFLNKIQTIQGAEINTHSNFKRTVLLSAYSWNSAPIDGTDIIRSIPAVGRVFRFPFDASVCPIPPLNDSNNSQLLQYLRDIGSESTFATSILRVLIEDRREQHRLRHNSTKTPQYFKPGDIVRAHIQVNSKSDTGTVKKLSYRSRGPFEIIADKGHGSYNVRPYNRPTAAIRTYKSVDLYPLPPALFPSNPLDAADQRYLNYEHAPITNPLQQSLNIESYNDIWFDSPPPTKPSTTPQSADIFIDKTALNEHTTENILTLLPPCPPELTTTIESELDTSPPDPTTLASAIHSSKDKLFFVQFIPADTIRPKWFLIQVDLDLTEQDSNCNPASGQYQCSFLAKHQQDNKKSDERSRWWPDWYKYHICPDSGTMIFGKRMLIRPSTIPDPSKFILWATPLNLCSSSTFIHGPFNFETLNNTNRTHYKIHINDWKVLEHACRKFLLEPPTLNPNTSNTPNLRHSKRKEPT